MNQLLSLFENEPTITIPEGQDLLVEGKPVDMLFVLIAGEAEILKDGKRINIISEPGSIFGEMSYLLNRPATASVRASKYSCFYRIDAGFAWSHPEIYKHVSMQLAMRLAAVSNFLGDLETKLAAVGNKSNVAEEVSEQLKKLEDLALEAKS